MDKGTVLEAVRFMEHCLEAKGLNISNPILFGSHTKGEAASESDIDIVIISKDFRDKDR
ncbi:MAG: nucleotidyltransferase domain-containing protein [Deltaproteobacteria bacterium]|nr:nucleotidyltransferase domain-containing protein [Deltaproteobacteria bacterium]